MCAKQLASLERSQFTNADRMHEQVPTCAELIPIIPFYELREIVSHSDCTFHTAFYPPVIIHIHVNFYSVILLDNFYSFFNFITYIHFNLLFMLIIYSFTHSYRPFNMKDLMFPLLCQFILHSYVL